MSFLTQTPLLTVAQIGEHASALDALHQKVLKAIARLQKDVDTRKSEIANRWKSVGIDAADKARFAKNETLAAVRQIKDNAEAELDRYLKEAGAPHEALMAQRPFYSSPVQVLNRSTLGDSKRTAFLQQLQFAGPVELGHLAQVAVSSKDAPLAAAVVSLLDKMPSKDRPVGPAEVATAMKLEDYLKVQEYLKLGDARLQGVIVAIRTWKADKSNPINTLALALKERDINHDLLGARDDD